MKEEKRFRIDLVVLRAPGMWRRLSMRCSYSAEIPQIRLKMIFHGDEKVLGNGGQLHFQLGHEKYQGRNGAMLELPHQSLADSYPH